MWIQSIRGDLIIHLEKIKNQQKIRNIKTEIFNETNGEYIFRGFFGLINKGIWPIKFGHDLDKLIRKTITTERNTWYGNYNDRLINQKNFKPIPIKISNFLESYNVMVSKKTFSLTINSKIRLFEYLMQNS